MNAVLRVLIVVVAATLFALISAVTLSSLVDKAADEASDIAEEPDAGPWVVIPKVLVDDGGSPSTSTD